MENVKILTVTDFCRNFPKRPKREISRENLYEHIEKIFSDVSRVAYVEGEPLTGKSEVLAGFMRANGSSTLGVFLAPGDAYFYSPEYVKLVLAEQMHWLLTGKPANYESMDQLTFTRLVFQLQKLGRQTPITFVLDGLVDRGLPEHRVNQEILEVLPFSQSEFRFLISGSAELLTSLRLERHKPKPAPLIPIGKEEATLYFQDIIALDAKDIADIRTFCGGAVGLMAKFRDLIRDGLTVQQVFADKNGGLSDLLEFEWAVLQRDDLLDDVLSCICFSNRILSLDQLALVTRQDTGRLTDILRRCRCVQIDPEMGSASIPSIEQKNFIRKKLAHRERTIQERFISELLRTPESSEATRYLPAQLMTVGRYEDIVKRLDHDHFVRLLEAERSLRALRAQFELGLSAAKELGDEEGVLRFGLSSSVMTGLTFSVGTKRRIEALMHLGQTERAIELALAAPTNEERLQLLAATARSHYDNKLLISGEVKKQIRELVRLVSRESLGGLATDIACDLLVVDLNAAIQMFDASTELRETESNGFGKSLRTSSEASPENQGLGSINFRLNDRHSEKFAEAVASLVKRLSAEKMLVSPEGIAPATELFMLKQWLGHRKEDPLASQVADHALDITLKDVSRAPRIEDFRAIAVVLPYMADIASAEKLVKRIEAQLGAQLTLGTTAESVRLEMLLERVRYRTSREDSDLALINIFLKVSSITDAGVKAAALAWMLYSLQRFPDPVELDDRTGVITETTTKLVEAMELLLQSSADHYQAARGAVYALARANIDFAFELISKLNLRSARDRAFGTLADEIVSGALYVVKPGALLKCLNGITDEHDRSLAITRCLTRIATKFEADKTGSCNEGITSLWRSVRMANLRFQAAVAAYRIILSTTNDTERASKLADEIREIWSQVLVDWVRTDLGYLLVRDVAKVNQALAEQWLGEIVEEKQSLKAPSEALSNVLAEATQLVIRCFGSVIPKDAAASHPFFSRVGRLISAVPQPQRRLQMWCDLGIRLHYRHESKLCSFIAETVQKICNADFKHNEFLRDLLVEEAAPFLYLHHAPSAHLLISQMEESARKDTARRDICTVILRKRPLSDAFQAPASEEFEVGREDVAMLLDVMRGLKDDTSIFELVVCVANSVVSKQNEHRFRRTQVRDYLHSLHTLVEEKLPDLENIKHEGYKIACRAHLLRATSTLGITTVQPAEWTALFSAAKEIPNVADRVVVIGMVAACARARANVVFPSWYTDLKNGLASIPTDSDRIDRYQWIAQLLEPVDKGRSAQLIQDAVMLSKTLGEDEGPTKVQQKLLDLAYNINPDLVDKLIDLADNDKASTGRKEFVERKRMKDLQKSVADDPKQLNDCKVTSDQLAELCSENLAKLNGNRIPARRHEDFASLAEAASNAPLGTAYPMWSWIAENAVRRADSKAKGEEYVHRFFEAACSAGELVLALTGNAGSAFQTSNAELDGLIRPGDRDAVFSLISRWALKNDGKDLLISDPFFGPSDLDVLYAIAEAAPASKVRILSSKKHLRDEIGGENPEEAFRIAWRDLCDISPPDTEISLIGVGPDGTHPIHDRWLLSKDAGLRLGTSTNSIGKARLSEISQMDATLSGAKFDAVTELLNRSTRDWNGSKIQLTSFDLN